MSQQPTPETKEPWTLAKFIEAEKNNLSEDDLSMLNTLLGLSGFKFTSASWIPRDLEKMRDTTLSFTNESGTSIQITLRQKNKY